MKLKIYISNKVNINICPYCYGSGKLKAMQSVTTYNGGSIRGKDTTMKCRHCNENGLIK